MLAWYAAAVRSQITVCWHVATNMLWPLKCFSTAFMWTDPLLLATVPQQVSPKLTVSLERPAAAKLWADVGTLASMHALVQPESRQLIKTSTTAIKLTLQLLTANEVLPTMWHHVPLVCKWHSAAGIRTAVTHANIVQSVTGYQSCLIISAKWTEWTGEISCDALFSNRLWRHRCMCYGYCGRLLCLR